MIFGCNNPKIETEDTIPNKTVSIDSFYLEESEINSNEWKEFKIDSYQINSFDYKKFEIRKGQLGEIKIGMTISEAEQKFTLRKEKDIATNFGYSGGSPAYLYYKDSEPAFALIPKLDSDIILFIIVIDNRFTLANELNPKSSVKDISKKYPKTKVNQDLMNGWEYIFDEANGWQFVFKTDELKVGNYSELEVPSDLVNLDIKTDWVVIK